MCVFFVSQKQMALEFMTTAMFRTLPHKKTTSKCDFYDDIETVDEHLICTNNKKFAHNGQQVKTCLFEKGTIHKIFVTNQHIILYHLFWIEVRDKMENLVWSWSVPNSKILLLDDSTLLVIASNTMTGYSLQGKRLFERYFDAVPYIMVTWDTFIYALFPHEILVYQHQ